MSRFWSSPVSSRGCPGTAPLCAARCPASLVKVVGARRQAFARSLPVAGAKADAGWNGFLPLGRARSAAETRATHSAQLAASFDRCREAHAAIRLGFCDFAVLLFAQPLLPTLECLAHTQERFQRSVIGLSGVTMTARAKLISQKPAEPIDGASANLKAERDRQLFGR